MSVIIAPECFQDSHQIQDLSLKPESQDSTRGLQQCPQCGIEANQSSVRLVHDTCGHLKCRLCLCKEEHGCITCEEERLRSCTANDTQQILFDTTDGTSPGNFRPPVVEERATILMHHQPQSEPEPLPLLALPPASPEDHPAPASPPLVVEEKRRSKRRARAILKHIETLPGTPPSYKCLICMKSFKTRTHIRYHEFCLSGAKPYKCNTCGQGFVAKAHFEYHQRTHTGERPYQCQQCGSCFNQKGKLTRHIRMHTDERPYMCEICSKGFRNAYSLNNHTLIHQGTKPHQCNECGKRFTEMSNLKKHAVTHSNARPYMCEECGRSFSLRSALNMHSRIHDPKRAFLCDTCERYFSNSRDLKRHQVTHTDVRSYVCKECKITTRRKDNLERHMRNLHPELFENNPVIPVATESPTLVLPEQLPILLPPESEPARSNAVPVINSAPSSSSCILLSLGYTARNLHPETSPHLFIASKNISPI